MKSELIKEIKSYAKSLPIEEASVELTELERLIEKLKEKALAKVKKANLTRCKNCGKYFDSKNLQVEHEEVIYYDVCVYTDCGYGDDDEFADVTYLNTYVTCPHCHKKHLMQQYEIGETNRHRRY